jgi:hypothetical protein
LGVEVDNLAVPRDERHGAGNFVPIHVALDVGVNALKALGRHANALGFHHRQIGFGGALPGARKDDHNRERRHED